MTEAELFNLLSYIAELEVYENQDVLFSLSCKTYSVL